MELKPVNSINNDANTIRVSDGNSPIRLIFKDAKGEVINLYDKIDYFYLTKDNEKFYSVTDISYEGDEVIIRLPKLRKGKYKAEIRDKDGSIYPANEDLYILLRQSFEDDKDIHYFGHREDILNSVEPMVIQHIDKNPNKFRGERGQQGFPGRDGLRGLDGQDGKDGKDGDKGDKGEKGITDLEIENIKKMNHNEINKKGLISYKKNNGMLVILDDDSRKSSYNILYKWALKNRIPITIAINSKYIIEGTNDRISINEFNEMKESGIVEFVNHTHTHPRLTELTEKQIREEIELCEKFLNDNGIYTKHLVYPFGAVNDDIKKISSDYVYSASKSNGLIIDPLNNVLDSMHLNRIVFETEMSTFKNNMVQAVETGGCVLINSHSQYDTFSTEKLDEIISEARKLDMEIVTYSQAFKHFANAIEIRDDDNSLIGGVSGYGYKDGNFKIPENESDFKYISSEGFTINSPSDDYPVNKMSVMNITTKKATDDGFPKAGVLFTYQGGSNDYTFQLFHPLREDVILKRTWNTSTLKWTDFNKGSDGYEIESTRGAYTIPPKGVQNFSISDDRIKLGDIVSYSTNTRFSNILLLSTPFITADGIIRFRLYNLSDTLESNLDEFTIYIKKV